MNEDNDWFEITEDLWLDPRTSPKKLKLCSDSSIPQPIVSELRSIGIPVVTAYEDGVSSHSDSSILAWAKREKRILLTMDHDFWDDRKFPLQTVRGLIFIDVSPEDINSALKAFGLIYGTFASSYSLEWWQNMKARATTQFYLLKMRSWEGKVVQYEIKLEGGITYAREKWL